MEALRFIDSGYSGGLLEEEHVLMVILGLRI